MPCFVYYCFAAKFVRFFTFFREKTRKIERRCFRSRQGRAKIQNQQNPPGAFLFYRCQQRRNVVYLKQSIESNIPPESAPAVCMKISNAAKAAQSGKNKEKGDVMFNTLAPICWLIAVIVFTVAEVVSYQLIAIWFALGAVVSLIVSLFGASTSVQLVVFTVVSALALALTRPIVKKVMKTKPARTNADQVIGAQGVVVQPIGPMQKGRVFANGLDWSARAQDGQPLQEGEKVTVLAIEGVTLVVQREEILQQSQQ